MLDHSDHSGHVHSAHLDLVPVDANGTATRATHVAVNNGDWFNPTTWANGQVPGEGALVHIPAGVSVAYEGASDANLFIVRVDGVLNVYAENGATTKMVVDTIVTSEQSQFRVDARDATDGTVDIVFDEGGPAAHHGSYPDYSGGNGVTGRYAWDPEQLSLGLVASGHVDIKGQDVAASLQLAEGPGAGATTLVFDAPLGTNGWSVGQKIVVGGTSYLGRDANENLITQDEVRTITDVQLSGGQMIVTLDAPLVHDHSGPTNPLTGAELTGYVGNLTRNVTFSSAAADRDGDGIPADGLSLGAPKGASDHYVTERGHIMFMHNDDVSMVDAALVGLGRTDKSIPVDDLATNAHKDKRLVQDNGTQGSFDPDEDTWIETAASQMTNPRGRYAVHLHEAKLAHDGHCDNESVIGPCPDTGGPVCMCGHPTADQDGDGIANADDDDFFHGAYLEGNVVWGSPGWGIVQHSSDAVLDSNVVFDVAGAAIVSELGDEAGRWEGNLTVGTYGAQDRADTNDSDNFNEDDGVDGSGYYLKSRAIDMVDNVAQSSARAGFFYHNAGGGMRETDADDLGDAAAIAHGADSIASEDVPIRVFEGNEAIAARVGIRIMTDPLDAVRKFSDAWSHMKDFTAWEIDEAGVSITYSSKYVFEDFLILGTESKITPDAIQTNAGFYFKASVADITVLNSHVESFQNAVTNWVQVGDRQEYKRGFWDPKAPETSLNYTPDYEGMGAIEGITNVAHNLWNTNIVGLTYDDIPGVAVRSPSFSVETAPGVTQTQRGVQILNSVDDPGGKPGVSIELLGDSRDGGFVALWREDLANNPNQEAVLSQHIPLAYQESVYLGQVVFQNGVLHRRESYLDEAEGINADIWSGTILEFAKDDSLGRQVFLYGDFAPLDPSSIERTVTTNERIVFSREMIDGVLRKDGFYTVAGIDDAKFIVMESAFTDRLTGDLFNKKFLMALDLAWELPSDAVNKGLLLLDSDMIIAPQYRVFENGVLVDGRAPIVLGSPPSEIGVDYDTGFFATEGGDDLRMGAAEDRVTSGGGDDIVRGFASADWLDGGAGDDALFGGDGWDRLTGGEGNDLLDGHLQRDFLFGGAGDDQLQGGVGRDELNGGADNDQLDGGGGKDMLFGGSGEDILDGGNGRDTLDGGDGSDQLAGGGGFDLLRGGAGDDVMAGNAGNDEMYGEAGSDLMNGGARADQLFGGAGADMLLGDAGADRLFGGDGDDNLAGQLGVDRLYGEAGNDVLDGGSGVDRLFGGDGNDRLAGGFSDDRLTGGSGGDEFVFEDNHGTDVIVDFEDGVDAIEFLIQSFGFEDLTIIQDGDDAVVSHDGGQIRLVALDGNLLDQSDFSFGAPT